MSGVRSVNRTLRGQVCRLGVLGRFADLTPRTGRFVDLTPMIALIIVVAGYTLTAGGGVTQPDRAAGTVVVILSGR